MKNGKNEEKRKCKIMKNEKRKNKGGVRGEGGGVTPPLLPGQSDSFVFVFVSFFLFFFGEFEFGEGTGGGGEEEGGVTRKAS